MRASRPLRSALLVSLTFVVLGATRAAEAHDLDGPGAAPRTHDGWYLRLGVGPGLSTGSAKNEGVSVDVRGMHVGTEIALGKTIAPGLVIGGGEFSMVVLAPKYSVPGGDVTAGTHHTGGIGPFVDYYLDPHGGLHVQGALLLSGMKVDAKGDAKGGFGMGFGAMAGAGWETWVADQWSVGGVLRLAYYRDSVKADGSDVKSTVSFFAPTVLFVGTYH